MDEHRLLLLEFAELGGNGSHPPGAGSLLDALEEQQLFLLHLIFLNVDSLDLVPQGLQPLPTFGVHFVGLPFPDLLFEDFAVDSVQV